ncbi:MAG: septum formation initiator family protein [Thermoanaerobaculia bacterium]
MKDPSAVPRGPRPLAWFLWSVAATGLVLAFLLVTDPRLLELKKARAEVRELDRKIAELQRENEEMRSAVQAASRHDYPAEKLAREELHLVRSDELVLLYPKGSLTRQKGAPTPVPTPLPTAPDPLR